MMLEVKDATVAVGERVLVRGLSFIARGGELTCITGQRGSGKTSLLRTLMGFLPVVKGFVSVDGELLTIHSSHAFRSFMTYLPQETRALRHHLMPPGAPVCEADVFAVWNEVLPQAKREKAPEPLASDDIFKLVEKTLQGSEKRIVIADEPAAYLSSVQANGMLTLLRQQKEAGKTVLIASRNPMLVAYADQVIDLDRIKQ